MTAADETLTQLHSLAGQSTQSLPDWQPPQTASGIYLTVHGHFYQPPRENPYLNTIERQPSAEPFHNWNERIHHECYRPNAFARVYNDQGATLGIVNNFEYLSFNIGPTLMSWLEHHDLEVYQRILDGDRKSCERNNGHGNAIAQVYNHIIMPLANERDKQTQIRWGKADFRARFGREPEGLWLAETAVDHATLQALVAENIRFIILAPSQAERCRPLPSGHNPEPDWQQVGGGQIDPNRPYRCFVDDEHYIDIFFYDGPISRDMGFNEVLSSSSHLLGRLGQAIKGDGRPSQLINVATDGETFGHHKSGTEKCLAYALTQECPKRGWTVTNFAHYLSLAPPTWEVELKAVTAWSCSHGVERWQADCGCGGGGGQHQKWRRPLRDALNWLRDQLILLYEDYGSQLFRDPWAARDDYIRVILERSPHKVKEFLAFHQHHPLTDAETIDALRLLEMQRHALLMFTSCGWFFEELSRPEGVQILRYAARALELAGDIAGAALEAEFTRRLANAPSNYEAYGNGAQVYQQLVTTAQINLEQVAAHYGISSLFTAYPSQHHFYCYEIQQLDFLKQQMGVLTLAVGQIQLCSQVIGESQVFNFAALHMGSWDFHCCVQPFSGRRDYSQLKSALFEAIKQASMAQIVLTMNEQFGDHSFGLQHLCADERYRVMQQVTAATKQRLDQLYTQVYRDNYGILVAFQRDNLPVPRELQVAAEIALSHRCWRAVQSLEQTLDDPVVSGDRLAELRAIAAEASHLGCQLQIPEAKGTLEQLIVRSLWQLLRDHEASNTRQAIELLISMIDTGQALNLGLSFDRAQELYYQYFHEQLLPNCLAIDTNAHHPSRCDWHPTEMPLMLKLGQKLDIYIGVDH